MLGSSPTYSCPSDGGLKKKKKKRKKESHTFVLICSYNCLDEIKIVLFLSYLWDIKGKAPASYQSLCLCSWAVKEWDHGKNVDVNLILLFLFGCMC